MIARLRSACRGQLPHFVTSVTWSLCRAWTRPARHEPRNVVMDAFAILLDL